MKTGFIPTMGALHNGHISLINQSKKDSCFTISSIFVNPTQFNNPADFEKYPNTLSLDINKLEAAGCDLLFIPSHAEIYPDDFVAPHYNLGFIETVYEGKYRPGHFQGVCMVVHRLLEIFNPDILYLGQKDYQQCMVLEKLISLIHSTTKIKICPTLREPDGLAMSSRNIRLSPEQRIKAAELSKALRWLKENIKKGDVRPMLNSGIEQLEKNGFSVDYFATANASTLEEVNNWNGQLKIVAIVAAYLGEIRLIDNLLITYPS